MEPSKSCSRCKIIKPLSEFYKRTSAKDGHSYCCTECEKKKALECYHKKMERREAREARRSKDA